MALDTTGFPSAQIALTLTDYTTPTPLTVPVALVGDTILPQERPQESNSQFENTASGKAHVGELVNGQAAPPRARSPSTRSIRRTTRRSRRRLGACGR